MTSACVTMHVESNDVSPVAWEKQQSHEPKRGKACASSLSTFTYAAAWSGLISMLWTGRSATVSLGYWSFFFFVSVFGALELWIMIDTSDPKLSRALLWVMMPLWANNDCIQSVRSYEEVMVFWTDSFIFFSCQLCYLVIGCLHCLLWTFFSSVSFYHLPATEFKPKRLQCQV